MLKPKKRTIGAIAILMMLSASPLSVTYSFADIGSNHEAKVENNSQKEELGLILTEKVIDGKLKVQHYALPNDATEEDMRRIVSVDGGISGWAYVNYKEYHSGIVLFDGKASKVGENLWKISSNVVLNSGERIFDAESDKESTSFHITERNTTGEEVIYRVIFLGKIGEMGKENEFAVFFMKLGLNNPEMGQNIKSLHITG